MLKLFWEGHDPTQGMRQGNDVGTQYRSVILWRRRRPARSQPRRRGGLPARLTAAGHGEITTEIAKAGPFYYAEDYHQQYLAKNPGGYCGLGGTGVSCPVGLASAPQACHRARSPPICRRGAATQRPPHAGRRPTPTDLEHGATPPKRGR